MLPMPYNHRFLRSLSCSTLAAMMVAACGGGSGESDISASAVSDVVPVKAEMILPSKIKAQLSASASSSATASPLKYFGYAAVDCGVTDPNDAVSKTNYVTEVAAFSNFAQMCAFDPADNIVSRLQLMSQNNVQAMLSIQAIFFYGVPDATQPSGMKFSLFPNYKARWNTFIANNSLAQHTAQIAAFYIVDEPVWNGVSAQDLKTASDTVKASFPSVPTTLIESAPGIAYLQVPTSIDWIGFDHYAIANPQTDLVFQAELALLKSKRSTSSQKILLTMDAQWLPFYGASGFPESYMSNVVTSYYNIAKANPEVIGIIGYTWPGGLDSAQQKGTRDLPQNVLDENVRVGKLITGK
jgi:hypothetical protein